MDYAEPAVALKQHFIKNVNSNEFPTAQDSGGEQQPDVQQNADPLRHYVEPDADPALVQGRLPRHIVQAEACTERPIIDCILFHTNK